MTCQFQTNAGFRPDQRRGKDGRWTKQADTPKGTSVSIGGEDGVGTYLNMMVRLAGDRPSNEALILKHGRKFKPPVSVEENDRLMEQYGIDAGMAKDCFANSGRCVIGMHPDITYVEGYAAGIIPVHHAWLVTKDGQVIDPTWNGQISHGVTVDPGHSYYGVPLKQNYVRQVMMDTKYFGIFSYTNPSVYDHGLPEDAIERDITHNLEILPSCSFT